MNVKDFLTIAIGTLTLLSMVCAGIFWIGKYLVLPWLKENLVQPVNEVNKQVSVNSFVSKEPTMLDRIHTIHDQVNTASSKIHDVEQQVDGVETKVNTANNTLGILSGVWEHQMQFNSEEFRKIWAAIHQGNRQLHSEGSDHNDR